MINTKKILTNKYYNENDRASENQCLTAPVKNICGNRYYTSNGGNENLSKSDYKIINTVETLSRPQCREDTMLTGPNINTLAILKSSPNILCETIDGETTQKTTCECCGYQLKLTKCKCPRIAKSVINPLVSSNLINSTLCQFASKTRCS